MPLMTTAHTLEDIARLARVSRSTVSRVVNNDPHVDPLTRARVQTVIQNANYHPNMAARGLAAGRTRVLGLVIPMAVATLFADPYFPLLIQGISSAANANDYSVMLWLAEPEYERRMIRQILQGGLIDGVIVASALVNDPLIEGLFKRNLPFVLVGRHPTDARVSYVDVDNKNSAREAVSYLLRLGRKRVATIAGPANMIAGADRLQGYLAALRDKALAPESGLIVEGDFTEESGYLAMQQLLPAAPDAVFCASDALAFGALRALRDAGKRVPVEVALIGYDDLPAAARTDPPLTTVRQPISRAGAVAVETLLDLIAERNNGPRRVILPTELVIRETCGGRLATEKRVRAE